MPCIIVSLFVPLLGLGIIIAFLVVAWIIVLNEWEDFWR